jgi:hypothetical protein
MSDSKCIYCNSKYYGRPCLYSPTKTHVHFGAPNKCIFCGSKVVGTGCPYNPYGKVHVKGPEFLASVKEQVEKSLVLSYLYENISKVANFTANSPLNRFYKRLAGIVANAGEPLLEALRLQQTPTYEKLTKEQSIFAFELKDRLKHQFLQINESVKHANTGLPQEIVEQILLDVIISNKDEVL